MNAAKRYSRKGGDCCATPIKGAVNAPKMTSDIPHIKNAVAMQPSSQGLSKIKGTVNGPKA